MIGGHSGDKFHKGEELTVQPHNDGYNIAITSSAVSFSFLSAFSTAGNHAIAEEETSVETKRQGWTAPLLQSIGACMNLMDVCSLSVLFLNVLFSHLSHFLFLAPFCFFSVCFCCSSLPRLFDVVAFSAFPD